MKVAPDPEPPEDDQLKLLNEDDAKEEKKKKHSCMDKFDHYTDKVCWFSIMDIIEDNCRVRATNVLIFLLVYVFFVLGMLHIAPSMKPVISKIGFSMGPPTSMVSFAESFLETHSRTAKVQVANDNGSPRVDVDVKTYVRAMTPMNSIVPCGMHQRVAMNNTLDALRFEEVCQFRTTGKGKTNKLGLGKVKDLGINGPAGYYWLGVEADGIKGEGVYTVAVRTKVFSMQVRDPSTGEKLRPPEKMTIGEQLAIQPSILCLDANGMPVQGVEVIAFSNQDPMWPPTEAKSPFYYRQGQKMSELGCSRSAPSDAYGFANFTCLTVLSSTSNVLNIVFTVGSSTFLPWNDIMYSFNNIVTPEVRVYRYPTYLLSNNIAEVVVLTPPPSEIEEGMPFPNPVRVEVTTANGPIAGVTCYALIVHERGLGNVMRYRRQLMGVTEKELLHAKSAPSDTSGIAIFSNLSFSYYGNTKGTTDNLLQYNISAHGIKFVCNGVESMMHMVHTVKTRAHTLRIKRFLRSSAYVSKLGAPLAEDGSDVFIAILRVVDKEGNGVAGKTIQVRSLYDLESNMTDNAVGLKAVSDTQESTKASGFAVVAFQVVLGGGTLKTALQQEFYVKFVVDGLEQASQALTLKARQEVKPDQCYCTIFDQVFLPIAGDYNNLKQIDLAKERPTIVSGQAIIFNIKYLTAASNEDINYLSGATGGGGRRLAEDHTNEVRRRLGEAVRNDTIHEIPRRRLISSDSSAGKLYLQMTQAYSDKGTLVDNTDEPYSPPELLVHFEPDTLTMPNFLDVTAMGLPNPSLDLISANGGLATAVATLQGANGTHWIQVESTIARTNSTVPEFCYSPPMSFNIINSIAFIHVACRRQMTTGRERIYTFSEAQDIIIDLTFQFVDGAPIPGAAGSGMPALYLTNNMNDPGGVYRTFIEVPMIWQNAIPDTPELDVTTSKMTQMDAFRLDDDGKGNVIGKIPIKLQIKLPGLFGKFALMFGSAGTFSAPFPFEVSEPPNLAAEIIAEPSMVGETVISAQNMLPQSPIIRITSNGQPINGVRGFAELVPSEGAVFTKMTEWPLFDMFGMSQSYPSGYKDAEAKTLFSPGEWWYTPELGPFQRSNWTGVAIWPITMLLDGYGQGKVRLWLGEKTSVPGLFPSNGSLNFRSGVKFKVSQQPPPTMPLGMPLKQIRTDTPFTVHMEFPYGMTMLANFSLFLSRFSVGKYNGRILSKAEAQAKTQLLFKNFGCVWAGGQAFGGCGGMTQLAGFRVPTFSFQVTGMTWMNIEEIPTTLSILPSDLSISPLLQHAPLTMPASMPTWGEEKQNEYCMWSAIQSLEGVATTRTIAPEVSPASAQLVIPPPEVVEVGSTFLVRLLVLTASGGAVSDNPMMVNIVPTMALNPDLAGGALLQQMSEWGNTLKATITPDVMLDPDSHRAVTGMSGVASFPLSIWQAKGGNYELQFQSDQNNARILFTTPAFTVVNPLLNITSVEDWENVEVDTFDEPVKIPKQLKFDVRITGNRTLEDLVKAGYRVDIHLSLKGVSPKVKQRLQQMSKAANNLAQEKADSVVQAGENVARAAGSAIAGVAVHQIDKASNNAFERMSPELKQQCLLSTMGSLMAEANKTAARVPELANAVKEDPDILSPQERVTQFVRTFTGAGQRMALSSSMRIQLEKNFGFEDLALRATREEANNEKVCTYEVITPIDFKFVQDGIYAWKVAINGVASKDDAFPDFTALKIQPTPPENAWNWVVNSIVVILGVVVLTTNTNLHHWLWFAFAIPFVIIIMCVVPTLKNSKDALLGAWPAIAEIFLVFVLLTLIWGLIIELMRVCPKCASAAAKAKTKPFGHRRIDFFEEYATRRMMLFISQKADADGRELEPHPATLPFKLFCKQMFRPFNPQTAFYFPSQVWTGMALSMLSFGYILIRCIRIIEDIDSSLMSLVDRAIQAVIMQINTIEGTYQSVAGGAELPDDATNFMITQIELVKGWFENLVATVRVGFIIGCVVSALVTIGVQFYTFYVFRRWSLLLRKGICAWGKRADGAIVYDSMFIGQYVATTIIGFVLITIIVTIIIVPFHFKILWKMLWQALPFIIWSFIVPFVLNKIILIVVKKLIFQPFSVKHRAAASIYMFWQLWLSILGGVMGALVRFGMAAGGLLLGLPTVTMPVTPEPMNKIMLLDSPYKTFLAAITMYHVHNHPIVIYAARCLSGYLAQRQNMREMGEKNEEGIREASRKKAKRWVILILMTHPHLAYWRKHAIKARRIAEARDKAERAKQKADIDQKRKPAGDEVAIISAITELKMAEDSAIRRIDAVEAKYAEIRQIPPGDERNSALQKLLHGMEEPRG